MELFDALFSIATTGANTFMPANGLLNFFTLDARTSYPWPLAWGNALWGYVAYKMYRGALAAKDRPGFVYGCAITFIFYTMPANIFTNLLIFGRTPSALTSGVVLPIHMMACVLLELCPPLFTLCSSKYGLAAIDTMGVLDNITTAFNFLGEMAIVSKGSPYVAVLAASTTNLGGGIARHFMANGYVAGAASFDAKFRANVLVSLAANFLYYYYAVVACAPQDVLNKKGRVVGTEQPDCSAADTLYIALPIVFAVKNLLPLFMPETKVVAKHKKL